MRRVFGGLVDAIFTVLMFVASVGFFFGALQEGSTPWWSRLVLLSAGFLAAGFTTAAAWEGGAVSMRRQGRPTEDLPPERPVYNGDVVDHRAGLVE